MQTAAPQLQYLSREWPATHQLDGLDNPVIENFGRQCLVAWRASEQGVRFVQVSHIYKWDRHSDLRKGHLRQRDGG